MLVLCRAPGTTKVLKMKKYLLLGFPLLFAVGSFFACSPQVVSAERTPEEKCQDLCKEAGECFGDFGSGISAEEYVEDCSDNCQEGIEEIEEIGCVDDYEEVLDCFLKLDLCEDQFGSGENGCEDELEDYYVACFPSRGSGSY